LRHSRKKRLRTAESAAAFLLSEEESMAPPEMHESVADDETKHGAIGHLSADEELQQAVCQALIKDTELDSSGIGVRISNDAVVLSGSVKNDAARLRAVSVAKAQRGVTNVQADDLCISDA
jgi:osmotically-inducible protein OsmY